MCSGFRSLSGFTRYCPIVRSGIRNARFPVDCASGERGGPLSVRATERDNDRAVRVGRSPPKHSAGPDRTPPVRDLVHSAHTRSRCRSTDPNAAAPWAGRPLHSQRSTPRQTRPATTTCGVATSAQLEGSESIGSHLERGALVDPEDLQRTAEAEVDGQAQREVENLGVAELAAQPPEQLLVDRTMVDDEALGVLDGEALPLGVAAIRPVLVEVGIGVFVDSR